MILTRHQLRALTAIAGSVLATTQALAQHRHINAGATRSEVGAPLFFANGSSWDAGSRHLIRLPATNSATYGPIYFGGAEVTFTSLAATLDHGGPVRFAALPGTQIQMVMTSVDGPTGGVFSFWDSYDGFFEATEITFSLPSGSLGANHRLALSENDGSPTADPYGHIHGRKFSANLPGLYRVGFYLVDTSTNGPTGGPLHAPSEVNYFYFQAGTTLQPARSTQGTEALEFGTVIGLNYWIETTTSLGGSGPWETVGGPLPGTGRLEAWTPMLTLTPTSQGVRFYRLRVE